MNEVVNLFQVGTEMWVDLISNLSIMVTQEDQDDTSSGARVTHILVGVPGQFRQWFVRHPLSPSFSRSAARPRSHSAQFLFRDYAIDNHFIFGRLRADRLRHSFVLALSAGGTRLPRVAADGVRRPSPHWLAISEESTGRGLPRSPEGHCAAHDAGLQTIATRQGAGDSG